MKKINLNSILFNDQITKNDILSCTTQEEIFNYYIEDKITINTVTNSPLREDNIPSFGLYYRKDRSGILMFNDLATHDSGDCFVFVGKLFNLGLKKVLQKIAFDFGLSDLEVSSEKVQFQNNKIAVYKETIKIGIKSRPWLIKDANFWKSFGIKKSTLIKYNVLPIVYVFFNDNIQKVDDLSYAYQEYKDDQLSYKIYQPFNSTYKWINNANYTVHQGYSQLPKTEDLLIITKSIKDVMSLHDVMSIPSVGLQSESVMMKESVMDEYKSRFKQVVCLFDNDKAGIKLSEEFSEKYNISHFFMPNSKGVSDFSDLVKKIGVKKARSKFNKIFKDEIRLGN